MNFQLNIPLQHKIVNQSTDIHLDLIFEIVQVQIT